MNNDIEKILYNAEDIEKSAVNLGKQISEDYAGKKPILISVLKGAILWTVDVMRHIEIPLQLDFIDVSSYYGSTSSQGQIDLIHGLTLDVNNRDVLIMEDIVETGRTLKYLINYLNKRKAKSIKVCTLLDKKEPREIDVDADYVGFNVPNEFVVGYGLDYKGYYRNLPYIGVLKPSVYKK